MSDNDQPSQADETTTNEENVDGQEPTSDHAPMAAPELATDGQIEASPLKAVVEEEEEDKSAEADQMVETTLNALQEEDETAEAEENETMETPWISTEDKDRTETTMDPAKETPLKPLEEEEEEEEGAGGNDADIAEPDGSVLSPVRAEQSAMLSPAVDSNREAFDSVESNRFGYDDSGRALNPSPGRDAQSVLEKTPFPGEMLIQPSNTVNDLSAAAADRPDPSVLASPCTVRVTTVPENQTIAVSFAIGTSILEIKEHFSLQVRLAVDVLELSYNDRVTADDETLHELGVPPNGTILLTMCSLTTPIKYVEPLPYFMPDVLTVRVEASDGSLKDVVVEIEKSAVRKPFLGGYRDKLTGLEYHHASCQTDRRPFVFSGAEKFTRDAQTIAMHNRPQQVTEDTSTQMTDISVFVSNERDKLVSPRKYVTADQVLARRLEKVVVLQKYWRRWLAMKRVGRLRNVRDDRIEWERAEELRKKKEREDRLRRDYQRRADPKTSDDFDILYAALKKWKEREVARINEMYGNDEPMRKAALCKLLDDEVEQLQIVSRLRKNASDQSRENAVVGVLKKASQSKSWKTANGATLSMDTPYTQRAGQLQDIYNSLTMDNLSIDERLDILLTLKHTVKEHDCRLTRDIVDLINREADLLMRGFKETNLGSLRLRIRTLFLQYIKTPTFNPEIARLLKVPQDPAELKGRIMYCKSCCSYKFSSEFTISPNRPAAMGVCRACERLDNEARARQDLSLYHNMLMAIRRMETDFGDNSTVAFIMQEADIRYLTEKIWGSKSAFSERADLKDLVFVRWNKYEQWAPWNCLLLTEDEAESHMKLENLQLAYARGFRVTIQKRHTLAKTYFSKIPKLAGHIKSLQETAGSADERRYSLHEELAQISNSNIASVRVQTG